jgi:hypothetical protein
MSESIDTMISRLTKRQIYEFALACAGRVQHIMRDPRSIAALDTRERWLKGHATDEEMAAARDAAWASAWAAQAAAWDAAAGAAWAAWAAASGAAGDAASGAASASAAASAAASSGAWDAAWNAAWDAAWDAERAWQREELKRMLKEGGGA